MGRVQGARQHLEFRRRLPDLPASPIEPLFLDGLKEQFDAGFDSIKKLEVLLDQIGKIKIFDPSFMRNYCVSRDIGGHPAPRRVYPTGRLTQQISRQAVWRSAG